MHKDAFKRNLEAAKFLKQSLTELLDKPQQLLYA